MLASIVAAQLVLFTEGVCTTGSTRSCKLTGCNNANEVCLSDRTWGACTCSCDDGNVCTTDSWTGSACKHVAVSIDDGNPCTIDSCDPVTGVHHTPAAAGTVCSDNNACTVGDNFVFDVPGCTGCGVYSGRANKCDKANRCGSSFATNGCIRTTDAATEQLLNLIKGGDPLTTLTVD